MISPADGEAGALLRVLSAMQLGSSAADGLFAGTLALYLVTIRDVPLGPTALLLTASEICGMVGAAALGWASDALGRGATLTASYGGAMVASLVLGVAELNFVGMLIAASVVAFTVRGAASARNAVVADAGGAGRVRTRAYLRTLMNIGLLAGLGVAALVAASGAGVLYRAALAAGGLCYAWCAVLSLRLRVRSGFPGAAEQPTPLPQTNVRSGTPVWRKGSYLLTMASLACFVVNFEVLGLGMSLWLVGFHHAPAWLVPTALTVNSLLAIALQLRLSAHVDSVPAAIRAICQGLVWVSVGSLMLAVAPHVGAWVVVLAIAAAAVHTIGDVLGSAGQWGLEMDLADTRRQGEYQGMASLLAGAARALAPQLVVLFLLRYDSWGWFGLIAFFAVAAFAVRWSALRMWRRAEAQAAAWN